MEPATGSKVKGPILGPENCSHIRFAEPDRRFDKRVEHGLQIEGRAADDLEHVSGGGLLLQGFSQLVEQARVLDGNDGLGSEVRSKFDLLVGERPHLLATDADGADQLVVLEQRDGQYGAVAAQIDAGADEWLTVHVGLCRLRVVDLDRLSGRDDTPKG